MEQAAINDFAASLLGSSVGGYSIDHFINNGRSAVVFRAQRAGQVVALKVFLPTLIEQYGRDKQLGRIEREKRLIGHDHPNLIPIIGGGACPQTGHLYVVMAYLDGPNLESLIPAFPREKIGIILQQVAAAARYLEQQGCYHRDIKPGNIIILGDFERAVLLDLGVLRPIGSSSLTDGTAGKALIATLRYCSPDYLFRQEEPGDRGLLALTFYQLGGVLHDMIMQKPLFSEFDHPWTNLVRAIEHEIPVFSRPEVGPDLIELARNCLLKSSELRLRAISWHMFDVETKASEPLDAIRARVLERLRQSSKLEPGPCPPLAENVLDDTLASTRGLLRSICTETERLPPFALYAPDEEHPYIRLAFTPSADYDLERPVTLCVRVSVLDPRASAVEIAWAVAYSGGRPCDEVPSTWQAGFLGVFSAEAVRPRLELLIYWAIDKAQHLYTAAPSALARPPREPAQWLSMSTSGGTFP